MLDIRTLMFALSITIVALVGTLIHYGVRRKTYEGFLLWVLGAAASGVGVVLMGLRDIVPSFVSVIVANMLIYGGWLLLSRGLFAFLGRTVPIWIDWVTIPVSGALFLVFTYISPNLAVRIVFSSAMLAYASLRGALTLFMAGLSDPHSQNGLLLASMLIYGFTNVARLVLTVAVPSRTQDLLLSGAVTGVTLLVSSISAVLFVFAAIELNNQRLERDLERERNTVKTLSGLIPICAGCKKIRDDAGYWNQIEVYIKAHTDADFSHGLCPDCRQRLYPETNAAKSG